MREAIEDFILSTIFGLVDIIIFIMSWFFRILPRLGAMLLFSLAVLAAWIPLAVLQGFILQTMWEWFIVPLGIHALSLQAALGICLIVTLLTAHLRSHDDKKNFLDSM